MNIKKAFFEDMATALDSWTETGVKAMTDVDADLKWTDKTESFKNLQSLLVENGANKEDIRNVLSEHLRGISHTFLNILDGATAISNNGRRIFLVDKDGDMVGEGLHHDFIGHLFDTNRLE